MASIRVTTILLLVICYTLSASEGFPQEKAAKKNHGNKPPAAKDKVYFNAYRTSSFTKHRHVIPYNAMTVNVGNGMNPASGVFTAPKAGDYAFNFQAAKQGSPNVAKVKLQVNGKTMATAVQTTSTIGADLATLSISTILPLKAKDKVTVVLDVGDLHDHASEMYTHFSGILL